MSNVTLENLIEKERWYYKEFYKEVGMTEATFIRRRKCPGEFKLAEIIKIAEVLKIDDNFLYDVLKKEALEKRNP